MSSQRLVIYVTLLPDLRTVESYVVVDNGDGSSDLRNAGCWPVSKASLALYDELNEWFGQATDVGSPSTAGTRT